jgi:L-arabinose isomerase
VGTKNKVGLFGIGLDTYWDQFEGLLDNLNGYQEEIKNKIFDRR